MTPPIEGHCTVTPMGHTTLPKSVRQVLRLVPGAMVAFRLRDHWATVHAVSDHDQWSLALMPFLTLLEADLDAASHVLPDLPDPSEGFVHARADRLEVQTPILGKVSL